MFASRIESAAARAGTEVKFFTDIQLLVQHMKDYPPQMVVVNLDAAKGKLGVMSDVIKIRSCKTVGYYSHVNANLAIEARRIGIGVILSRGVFAARFAELLKELSSC